MPNTIPLSAMAIAMAMFIWPRNINLLAQFVTTGQYIQTLCPTT